MNTNISHESLTEMFNSRYRIISLLGKGGMGNVYLAEDLRLKGKLWAIKEIKIEKKDHQKFIDEAKMLATLNHPYLPNIIDYFPPDDNNNLSYLVMDYIKGKTMLEYFNLKRKELETSQIVKYAIQICDLLDYLHNGQANPVIYRDIKPSNIMIDENDKIRLIDFGIARRYKEGKLSDTVQLGTYGFAAPEQFENKQTDQRTDIYSLGALLFFLLSKGIYYRPVEKSLNGLRNDLPISLINIVNKMLKYIPAERYQNIIQVKRDLESIFNQNQEIDLDLTEKINFGEDETLKISHSDMISASINSQVKGQFSTKLVAIVNLSKRAGSTFLTLNLAKKLSEIHILASIIEAPFEPYIYDHIGLEQMIARSNNNQLYSIPHIIYEEKRIEKARETIENGIMWLVPDPRKSNIHEEKWTYHHMIKLLYSSRKANIMLLDIGSNIEHHSMEPLINEADLVLLVIDPMPAEIMANQTLLKRFLELRNEGLPIEMVINNWTRGVEKKDLLHALKVKPLSFIPHVDLTYIHQAVYQCIIPFELEEVKVKLQEPLLTILKKIVPKDILIEKEPNKKSWIKNWFKEEKLFASKK